MQIHTDPLLEPHKAHTSNTALVPTPYSRAVYEGVVQIQTTYNYLYHKVATDYEFLKSTLARWEYYQWLGKFVLCCYSHQLSENLSL